MKTNKKKYIFIKEHMINKYSIYMLLFLLLIMLINFTIVLYYIFKSKKKEKFTPGTLESAMDFHNIIEKLKPGKLLEFIGEASNYDGDTLPPDAEITYITTYITAPTTEQQACPAQQEAEVFPPILFIKIDLDTTPPVLPDDYTGFDFSQDFVLGKYPQNDGAWEDKYNTAKTNTIDPNPIVIEIPVIKGNPGPNGSNPVCEKGPRGEPGETVYDTCLQGVKGDRGPHGPIGDRGPSGNDCICEPGLPGPRGLDGIPGQPGISSVSSSGSSSGSSSCVCPPGSPGSPGIPGTNGINGKNCKYIHELDKYLPKHIYHNGTGFASAPYIKMGTHQELLQLQIDSDIYDTIYFDIANGIYTTDTSSFVLANNYILFITNKLQTN